MVRGQNIKYNSKYLNEGEIYSLLFDEDEPDIALDDSIDDLI